MMIFSKKGLSYLGVHILVAFAFALFHPSLFNVTARANSPINPCYLTINIVGNGTVTQNGTDTDPDLRVEIGPSNSYVLLENSQIRVEYRPNIFPNSEAEFPIKKFIIKNAISPNQLGTTNYDFIEAAAQRGTLNSATVIYNGTDRKTVRLVWNHKFRSDKIIHEVSIFPNTKFLKIDYINTQYGINIVDLGRPGGTSGGVHVAYGHEAWMALDAITYPPDGRGYITFNEPDPPVVGSYYNRYSGDGVNDPPDGGPLNYHGYFITGVYNPNNDVGFARAMPVAAIEIIKLLLDPNTRRGFELYPYPFYRSHPPYTGYLYGVTGGEDEVLCAGQQLADGHYYQAGGNVELTATPDPGWTFAGWSGDLSGSINPATLNLTGQHVVTATFVNAAATHTLTVATVGSGTAAVDPAQSGYVDGQIVTLTATANPGWTFAGWSGDLSGSTNPTTLTMDSDKVVTATFDADATPPVIDVWYGPNQVFGKQGLAQQRLNILGNVSDSESDVSSLVYSLNGVPGPTVDGVPGQLMIGPHPDSTHRRRLFFKGDFNINLDKDDPNLNDGLNTVVITATNGAGLQSTKTVTVEYHKGNTWPLPYSIDWSSGITDVQEVVQIVDGLWTWDTNGIRTARVGYDRILAIGDMSWGDYEVTMPITIHGIDSSAYGMPTSGGVALGVGMRWVGHTDAPVLNPPCKQLKCGWEPEGSNSFYIWNQTPPHELWLGSVFTTSRQLEIGKTYWYKQRIARNTTGAVHSLKIWEDGVETEPATWTLSVQTGPTNPANGSMILVAHHIDVTMGNVTIVPVTYTLTVSTVGSGTVTVEPPPNQNGGYSFGQVVTLTAVPAIGWHLADWSGDLSGSTSPVTMTITGDMMVTATFTKEPFVTVSPTNLNIAEGGATDTYEVVLTSAPTATVTINVNPDSQSIAGPTVLAFDNSNWNITQTVTITAVDDAIIEGPHTSTISHTVSSADSNYNGIAVTDVIANITDNDAISAPPGDIFLPMIMAQAGPPEPSLPTFPDLAIQNIIATSDGVQVTIINEGNAPVVDEFWVDFYVDPTPPPTGVNQVWDDGRSTYGVVWGVTTSALPINPGGTLTLSYSKAPGAPNAYYFPNFSNFPPTLSAGTPVYAQVDSANALTNYGAVLEGHEVNGGAYNNIKTGQASIASLTLVVESPASGQGESVLTNNLPPRSSK